MFSMPDETPFGQDHSLFGRPIIDYKVSASVVAFRMFHPK